MKVFSWAVSSIGGMLVAFIVLVRKFVQCHFSYYLALHRCLKIRRKKDERSEEVWRGGVIGRKMSETADMKPAWDLWRFLDQCIARPQQPKTRRLWELCWTVGWSLTAVAIGIHSRRFWRRPTVLKSMSVFRFLAERPYCAMHSFPLLPAAHPDLGLATFLQLLWNSFRQKEMTTTTIFFCAAKGKYFSRKI